MATPSHRKLSRKALKQPDEFVTTLERVGDLLANNLTRVIIGAVAVVAAAAIGFGFSFYAQHRERVTSAQFYGAINALSNSDYRTAEQNFTALTQDSPTSTLGRLARFYLATTYLAQSQPAKARDALKVYLAEGGDPLFRQMALTQLGVADEDLGDYRNAHVAYIAAAQLTGPEKARAQVGAARTLALLGDRQGAIDAYQRFLKENPFAPQRTEVIETLAQMGAPAEDHAPPHKKIEIPGGPPTVKRAAAKGS